MCLLAACTAKNEAADGGSEPETAVTVDAGASASAASDLTGKPSAAKTKDEVPKDADTVNAQAEDIAFIRFFNVTQTEREVAKDNERAVVNASFDVLTVEKTASDGETSLTALSRKLSELEYNRNRDREASFQEYTKRASTRNKQEKYDCDIQQSLSVLRADTRVFSFLEENVTTVDTAGASPKEEEDTYACTSYNLDAVNAKELRLKDVVKDPERLSELAAEAVLERYDTTNPAYNASLQFEGIDLQERILALLEDADAGTDGSFAWSPSYYGLRLIFSRKALCEEESLEAYLDEVSEINPRDLNRFDVVVPYTAEPSLFEAAYTELPPSCIARLESGVTYLVDFGNGPESLEIATPRKYENNTVLYTGECTVRLGENNKQSFDLIGAEEYGTLGVCVYLVKTEDAHYLYVDTTGRDETDRLHVYAIADKTVRFAGVSEEMLDNDRMPPFDPACFMAEGIFYILPDPFAAQNDTGTRGFRESYVAPGGMPKSNERFYEAAEEDIRVTAIDLTLDTLKDADDDRPEKEIYKAGTSLTMWRVERASHADLKADDGRMVRLYINGVDTIDLIDGHELYEAFADPRHEEDD